MRTKLLFGVGVAIGLVLYSGKLVTALVTWFVQF